VQDGIWRELVKLHAINKKKLHARAWAVPALCVGPLWPPSYFSLDLWKLPGKIRLQELVSSNSKNISCVSLLKHKNSRK
jgi:hypothetical protein